MGEEDGFDMAEYKAELDRIVASVMPDTWVGHGRLKIHERDFDPEARSFAGKLLARLDEKYPDLSGEKLAEAAIEKTEERFA